ncbi:MAG: acyltransferase [Gemmatimonadales bacterium]
MTATPRTHLPDDWYPIGLPSNIVIGNDVYIDSSYGFAAFNSMEEPGLVVGEASGIYDRAAMVVGPRGRVTVGGYTVLNGTYIVCDDRVDIGSHCLLSWGVVITDSWTAATVSARDRRAALLATAESNTRHFPAAGKPLPVVLEDNVWVGFDAVILPGVRVGRGAIIGARTIVSRSIEPYAVVAGNPQRTLRFIDADDTAAARDDALASLTEAPRRSQ